MKQVIRVTSPLLTLGQCVCHVLLAAFPLKDLLILLILKAILILIHQNLHYANIKMSSLYIPLSKSDLFAIPLV